MQKTILVLALTTLMAACSGMGGKGEPARGEKAAAKDAHKEKSLYDRLGGKAAITQVVDDFVGNVAKDKRINKFFSDVNIPRLKGLLVDQICAASGGPCTYTGRTMKEAHKGMGVRGRHFDALVEDLARALDKNKVGEQAKKDLLGALAPMKADIVEQGKAKRK